MNDVVVKDSINILEALKYIQNNKKRFLLCLDKDDTLLGVLSDGDIRRGLIEGIKLTNQISEVLNIEFEYLELDTPFDKVCEKFKLNQIDFLPIVDNNMKLVNVITKKHFHLMLLENINFDLTYDFSKFDEHIFEHEIYNRPWGFYKSTILTNHAQGKIITVFPREELSLQEHKKREEHWVIIKGKGKVILGESLIDVYPGKYIYIPKGCKHQIINNSNENIIFSEVQLGEYFGEDDIIRYTDKYGRIK